MKMKQAQSTSTSASAVVKKHNASVTAATAILRGWSAATFPSEAHVLRTWNAQSAKEREITLRTIVNRAAMYRQEQHQRTLITKAVHERDNAEKKGNVIKAQSATAKAATAIRTASNLRNLRTSMVTPGEESIIEYMCINTAIRCIYAHESIAATRERAQNRTGAYAAELAADILGMEGDTWQGAETEETRSIDFYGETLKADDGDNRYKKFDIDMYASDTYIAVKESGIVLDFLDVCACDGIYGGDALIPDTYNGTDTLLCYVPFSFFMVYNPYFDLSRPFSFQNRPYKTLPALSMFEMKENRRKIKIQHPAGACAKGTISLYTPLQAEDVELLDTIEPTKVDDVNPTPEELYNTIENREDIQKLFMAAPDLAEAIKTAIPCITDIYGNRLINYKAMSALYRKAQTIFSIPENIPENIKNALIHLGMNHAGIATYHAFIHTWKNLSEIERKNARERANTAEERKTAAEKAARRAAQVWRKEHPTALYLPSSIANELSTADRRRIERTAVAPALFTVRAYSAEGQKIRAAAIAAYMETAQQYYTAEEDLLYVFAQSGRKYVSVDAATTDAGERLTAYRYALVPEEVSTGRAFLRQVRTALRTWEKNPAARVEAETKKDALLRISAAILERHITGMESENAKNAAIVAMSLLVLSSLYRIIHLRDFSEYITIGDAAEHLTPERAAEVLDVIRSTSAATKIMEKKPATAEEITLAVMLQLQELKKHERKTAAKSGAEGKAEYITHIQKDTNRDTITTPATLPAAYLDIIRKAEQERRKSAKKIK